MTRHPGITLLMATLLMAALAMALLSQGCGEPESPESEPPETPEQQEPEQREPEQSPPPTGEAAPATPDASIPTTPAERIDRAGIDNLFKAGRFHFAGQPSEEALVALLEEEGVRTVVNIRDPGEQSGMGMNERAVVEEHSARYESIPVNRSTFSKADVDRFAAIVESSPGPILVHCASSTARAGSGRRIWRRTRACRSRMRSSSGAARACASRWRGPCGRLRGNRAQRRARNAAPAAVDE